MATQPWYRIFDVGALSYQWVWCDYGCGSSNDWDLTIVTKTPTGFAPIGDAWSFTEWDSTASHKQFLVATNRPDVVKPCTGYTKVGKSGTCSQGWISLWQPTHTDPNFIGIALAWSRKANADIPPPIGTHYCINRTYLVPNYTTPIYFSSYQGSYNDHGEFPIPLYVPIKDCGQIGIDRVTYTFRSDADVWQICAGKKTDIDLYPESLACLGYMKSQCSPEDIKIGGKCNDWCNSAMGKSTCDGIKAQFCSDHPNDKWCDCILATSRPAYTEEVKNFTAASLNSAPKPCRTKLCRDMTDGLDGYILSGDNVLMENCPALQYTDQSVAVSGSDNVVSTTQSTGNITTPAQAGISDTTFMIIIVVIVCIVIGIIVYFNNSGDDQQEQIQPMQYQPMQQYPQSV